MGLAEDGIFNLAVFGVDLEVTVEKVRVVGRNVGRWSCSGDLLMRVLLERECTCGRHGGG